MRKILYLTPFVPSNIGAGVNYSKLLIDELSKEYHIDLITYKAKTDAPFYAKTKSVRVIKEYRNTYTSKILGILSFPFLFPLFTVRFNWRRVFFVKKLIKKEHYDIIYFDFSQTFLFSCFIKHPHKILMSHDVITQRYQREKSKIFYKFCRFSEKIVLRKSYGEIFTFSQKDCDLILKEFNLSSTPTNFFIPVKAEKVIPQKIDDYYVFFGMWKRKDNFEGLNWFLKEVYFKISDQNIIIIGAALNSTTLEIIKNYSKISYLGFVDNPYNLITNAKALIAPLFTGAGVKVKVIDALACGTPVVGSEVSFEGIDDKYKAFLIEAKSPDEYVKKMEYVNHMSLDERVKFKKFFLDNYTRKTIIEYINNI